MISVDLNIQPLYSITIGFSYWHYICEVQSRRRLASGNSDMEGLYRRQSPL